MDVFEVNKKYATNTRYWINGENVTFWVMNEREIPSYLRPDLFEIKAL